MCVETVCVAEKDFFVKWTKIWIIWKRKKSKEIKRTDFCVCGRNFFILWKIQNLILSVQNIGDFGLVQKQIFFCQEKKIVFNKNNNYGKNLFSSTKMKVQTLALVCLALCVNLSLAQFPNGRILEPPVPALCAQRIIHEHAPDGKG